MIGASCCEPGGLSSLRRRRSAGPPPPHPKSLKPVSKPYEPVDHFAGSLRPPRDPEKSEKCLPGPPVWKSLEKVSRVGKKSRKGPEKTLSRLFPDPRRRPGRVSSDFFRGLGPEGPRDPCKWSTVTSLPNLSPGTPRSRGKVSSESAKGLATQKVSTARTHPNRLQG